MTVLQRVGPVVGPVLARVPSRRAKLAAFVLSPAVRSDPWALYAELREDEPVLRTRFGATLVSRHADVQTVLRSRSTSVDESRSTAFGSEPLSDRPFPTLLRRMLLVRDPPDHERLRRLVSRAFTPKRVAELRSCVEEAVEHRLDALDGAGRADVVDAIAYPVPVDVISRLLGVPERDHAVLRRWAAPMARAFDIEPMRTERIDRAGDAAATELDRYLRTMAADPAARCDGGLFEELLDLGDATDPDALDDAVATAALLLLAGHETTSNLLSTGLLALLEHPEQLDRLRGGDEEVAETATDELLRFTSPVQLTQRVALEPMELCGVEVVPGELLALLVGAANRDPAAFDRPDRVDLGRTPNPHLGFGTGIHACLGASLARLEVDVALPAIVRRWPNLRLDGKPRWRPSFILRGLDALPVRWT